MTWELSSGKTWPKLTGQVSLPLGLSDVVIRKTMTKVNEAARHVIARIRMFNRNAFASQGHTQHGGKNWRALLPSTVRRKGHATILVDTGKMRNRQSITGKAKIGKSMVTWTVEGVNRAEAAAAMQFGFWHFKAGFVKARPPIAITPKDAAELEQAINMAIFGTKTAPKSAVGATKQATKAKGRKR